MKTYSEVALASIALLLALPACAPTLSDPSGMGNGGDPPIGGVGAGNGGGGGSAAAPSTGSPGAGSGSTPIPGGGGPNGGSAGNPTPGNPDPTAACSGSEVAAPKRLIRLTFNQLVNSVRSLFGNELAGTIASTFEIGDPTDRTFPPLGSPREGSVVTDSVSSKNDAIAQAIGKHVLDNFAGVTKCGMTTTDDCARTFVQALAPKAFRRPTTERETAAVLAVYDGVRTDGGSVAEATQYAVYAIFSAPHFLYRTEFGTGALDEGPLSAYELASQLSFFLTDAPPDPPLLDAARNNALQTREQLVPHVDRLLASGEARVNLETAIFAYFGIPMLDSVVVDPAKAPDFTQGLRNAMYREAQLFLGDVLWNRPLTDVLTSRQSYVNRGLASLYGVDFATVASNADADGFAPVMLPENRAGLLTMPAFLTARSRPDTPSVVGRGLVVNATLLCGQNPPFPEEQAAEIEAVSAMLEHETERKKAEFRGSTPPCSGCHLLFDQYGLALETYDVIGKYRVADPEGRPIDASVTLPHSAGGAQVDNAVQMAAQLASGGAFTTCVAKNLLGFALAEGASINNDSCAVDAVLRQYRAGEQTFTTMVREVALSTTLSRRARGGVQ